MNLCSYDFGQRVCFSFRLFPWVFRFCCYFLAVTLYCTFRTASLLSFYIFFEIRLITTLFPVLGWGCLSERVQAGIYLSRLLTLDDGTDRLSRKVGKELPLLAA